MNFRTLKKSILVLEKSWKFVSEKGYEPCLRHVRVLSINHIYIQGFRSIKEATEKFPGVEMDLQWGV